MPSTDTDQRPTVQINLRLDPKDIAAIDVAKPPHVSRSAWIRGAIYRRLQKPLPTERQT